MSRLTNFEVYSHCYNGFIIRRNIIKIYITLFILIFSPSTWAFLDDVKQDYFDYYGKKGLPLLLAGLGSAALSANTGFDNQFRDYWQDRVRSPFTNDVFNGVDSYADLAQFRYTFPFYMGAMWLFNDAPIGTWGNRCMRTLLLGTPQQLFLTNAIGSGRPETDSPDWHWFRHNRGVSGHAFYGAIPFINIAKQTQNPWMKITAYSLSFLPGLARINNDKHYFSQSFLGWWLAFSAASIVWDPSRVSKKPQNWSYQLSPSNDGIYFAVNRKL